MGMNDSTGTSNFYIEDCDFHAMLNSGDLDDNAKAVVRYCLFNNAGFGSHGADTSNIGVRHYEFYNNTFLFNGYNDGNTLNLNYYFFLRGGTGAFTDNVITDITSTDYGNKGEMTAIVMNLRRSAGPNPGWGSNISGIQYPAPRQVGMGRVTGTGVDGLGRTNDSFTYVGDSEPMYIWNNTGTLVPGIIDYSPSDFTNPDSSVDYFIQNRNFFVGTAKPGYTKYTYPHPLRTSGVISAPAPTPTSPTPTPMPTAPFPPTGLRVVPSTPAANTRTYVTSFSSTENPISEGGVWINGATEGLRWNNVRTTPGLAFGTQSGFGGYDDSTAVISGSWGANQTCEATVHTVNQNTSFNEEVELRLRTTISPNSITGYEILFKCTPASDPTRYVQIVRWNGPLGSFDYIDQKSGPGINNGDKVKATIVGSTITAYVNGVQVARGDDSTFTTGSPGIGFFHRGGTAVNGDFGFTNFIATDGE
jgi:hypothetical protein